MKQSLYDMGAHATKLLAKKNKEKHILTPFKEKKKTSDRKACHNVEDWQCSKPI